MDQSGEQVQRGRWFKLVSRGAMVRLLVLAAILAGAGVYMMWMPGQSHRGPLPELTTEQAELRDRLAEHVRALAEGIGERNMNAEGSLAEAAAYVSDAFREVGYTPERHTYSVDGESVENIIAEVPGTDTPERIVVVAAHYDTVPGSPGANDNASGVAALIELARHFQDRPQPVTLRFISFVNEEPPFFQTEDMGSYQYARDMARRGDDIIAMMSMDGIGYYDESASSQQYPVGAIGWVYPSEGDFLAFVGRTRDAGLVREAVGAFRASAAFPSQGAALPGAIAGVGWSDHWAFWQHGYPGFMVTDTLPFRDPHYHGPGDTAERLDYNRMARVVTGLAGVVEAMARR
ncbi:M28 family peptidase [Phycisphaerales bacterium AB-hyl4]|uniref:M28 family peptidase n=1 Tax=Natronomicrosphaera hydrolytica TaxID=3242702 RepID=A0ABV4U4G2_9BACT